VQSIADCATGTNMPPGCGEGNTTTLCPDRLLTRFVADPTAKRTF
jgi:hypothetical protein